MKTMTLDYYQDPGHGWVRIHLDKLTSLGIAKQISNYSYVRGNHAYLEEDYDLDTLYKACDANGITLRLRDKHTNKYSKIRNYSSYFTKGE